MKSFPSLTAYIFFFSYITIRSFGTQIILTDLAKQLVVAELKAQVPESVISEVMPRLSDMMTFATKSKQQSEQNRRRRR